MSDIEKLAACLASLLMKNRYPMDFDLSEAWGSAKTDVVTNQMPWLNSTERGGIIELRTTQGVGAWILDRKPYQKPAKPE